MRIVFRTFMRIVFRTYMRIVFSHVHVYRVFARSAYRDHPCNGKLASQSLTQ